jgi:hypothetical protein
VVGNGRFDDPEREFRVLYAAAQRRGAFVETLAQFRPVLTALVRLQEVVDAGEPLPKNVIPPHWHQRQAVVRLRVLRGQRWLDLRAPATRETLRAELAATLLALGLADLDLGHVLGPSTALTQRIARWAHQRGYAGLAYTSRLDARLTLWALFEGAAFESIGEPETGDANDLLNLPYWTTQYVHLGPFRLTAFDPGEGVVLEAYDGYFLGRPKVDVVRVRFFGGDTALFSNLLAGSVHVSLGVLQPDLGSQLTERWAATGEGTVRMYSESTRFLEPQWRPELQREPANLDPRVRAALYFSLDRETLSDALQAGHPELVAYSVLPPIERGYEGTKDGLRQYRFDPDRARVLLREAGWAAASDGVLRNASDGRPYRTSVWTTPGSEDEVAAVAAYWRRLGMEVEELTLSPAHTRNNEVRASFPGWESSASFGDSILNFMQGPPATPQNRWTGNRAGYDDPRAQQLLRAYYSSLTDGDRFQTARALSDFVAAELPIMPLYYAASFLVARKGVTALEGAEGGAGAGAPYGTFTRSAHLWDVL